VEGGQPPSGVLGQDSGVIPGQRRAIAIVAASVALLGLALSACIAGDAPSTTPTPSAVPTPPPVAQPPPPRPERLTCRRLTFSNALAPTDDAPVVPCTKPHTGETYSVGQLRTTVAGHLVAVDSNRVQRQVADTCPRKLGRFLGGTPEALRLTMLRPIWFTPSIEQAEAGATWFRCDVVALAGDGRLAVLRGSLSGVLDDAEGVDTYGMCGTAAPDASSFTRVLCREDHSWRAISTVDLPGRRYPGVQRARDAGQEPCNDAARALADDVLDYDWGYEWPTREQWSAGQRFGRCWAPA
jgi:hypothetical protein